LEAVILRRWLVVFLCLFFGTTLAHAKPPFPAMIPNGTTNMCITCHDGLPKDKEFNPFGADVEDALAGVPNWADICDLDSDNDGFTNGEELLDPNCMWITGDPNPGAVEDVTLPGDENDFPEEETTDTGDDTTDTTDTTTGEEDTTGDDTTVGTTTGEEDTTDTGADDSGDDTTAGDPPPDDTGDSGVATTGSDDIGTTSGGGSRNDSGGCSTGSPRSGGIPVLLLALVFAALAVSRDRRARGARP